MANYIANFYVVGTPIGNLEDISLRALRVLGEVDLVLCEDTRVTKRLFDKHAISTPTMSYHAHSTLSKIETVIEMLSSGKNIALVSDAGTPGVSDPGSLLVSKIREALGETVKIESVPGPSALTAALSIAGFPVSDFVFLGFLPHKKGRETLFKEITASDRLIIFYESPHRLMKTLESLAKHLGADADENPRIVIVARELTKIFEELNRGSAAELLSFFNKYPDKVRGEFVVMVEGAQNSAKKRYNSSL